MTSTTSACARGGKRSTTNDLSLSLVVSQRKLITSTRMRSATAPAMVPPMVTRSWPACPRAPSTWPVSWALLMPTCLSTVVMKWTADFWYAGKCLARLSASLTTGWTSRATMTTRTASTSR